jgi:glutamate synthase (NADPH/NADH) small chain
MDRVTAFLEIPRRGRRAAPVAERVRHFDEFIEQPEPSELKLQAARCMDCGIPFCHSGCPVNNLIPDWNELVTDGDWRRALEQLHRTNNFPEFTGRVCPAPCEEACTLNLVGAPVTIKSIECAIVDRGWAEGWIVPQSSARGTGRRIAVIGSGPAGLACAQQLARLGHAPTVFEKADRIGGLLRYGIPDFKLAKVQIDRRIRQMETEGVIFRTGMNVGVDVSVSRLLDDYEVLVLALGAEQPRDFDLPGRSLAGVHFAMDYLTQQNRRVAGDDEASAAPDGAIDANGKHVVVVGGGDTGSDCIGTAHRQGALSVTQIEILPQPPLNEDKQVVWPHWPVKLRTSHSQEEGAVREYSVIAEELRGEDGQVTELQFRQDGVQHCIPADLVLLAMGFTGARAEGAIAQAGVALGARSTIETDVYLAGSRIFACGDARRGQSLVVWAIREGRECAAAVDRALQAV